jgi:hypothetical protein
MLDRKRWIWRDLQREEDEKNAGGEGAYGGLRHACTDVGSPHDIVVGALVVFVTVAAAPLPRPLEKLLPGSSTFCFKIMGASTEQNENTRNMMKSSGLTSTPPNPVLARRNTLPFAAAATFPSPLKSCTNRLRRRDERVRARTTCACIVGMPCRLCRGV